MPSRHAVLLTPPISLCPLFPYFLFSNSFSCHRSENSPVSLAIATLPKTAVSKPCACHTCETPQGVLTLDIPTFNFSTLRCLAYPLSFHILAPSFALFCTFLHSRKTQRFSFQSFPHSLPKKSTRGRGHLPSYDLQLSTLNRRLFTYNSRLASREAS